MPTRMISVTRGVEKCDESPQQPKQDSHREPLQRPKCNRYLETFKDYTFNLQGENAERLTFLFFLNTIVCGTMVCDCWYVEVCSLRFTHGLCLFSWSAGCSHRPRKTNAECKVCWCSHDKIAEIPYPGNGKKLQGQIQQYCTSPTFRAWISI